MMSVIQSPIFKNGTYRFKNTITKDGEVWNLTAATVTLILTDPGGTDYVKSASILSASGGTVYWDSTTADLDSVGLWKRQWHVIQGAIDIKGAIRNFKVEDPLA